MTDFRASDEAVPVTRVEQLVDEFHRAGKPRERWRIGTEYEKVVVERESARAARFSGRRGIEVVLRELAERFGWEPVEEGGRVIALARAGASITLEPGAQLELSGAPLATIHEAHDELVTHVREVVAVTRDLDLAVLALGIQPVSRVEDIEWVPKQRYGIMGPYMLRVGSLGQRMMKQTATVQSNLDYADERDAMRKLRVGMGLAPIINALFANSPIVDGAASGYLSFRGHVWSDTDRARCGLLPFAFRDDASFADYVEWALDVPLYFLLRDGCYRTDVTGMPFRRFLEHGADGERATMDDWQLHLTTLFPEVRVKSFIEFRSADSQPPERMLALSALLKGLLYEEDCVGAAVDLVKRWRFEEVADLYRDVVRVGLAARFRGIGLLEYAREMHAIASEGLRRQRALDAEGRDERRYLEPLIEQLSTGRSPAHAVLDRWTDGGARDLRTLVETTGYQAV